MAHLIVPLLLGTQFFFALISPILLASISLLTGALPLTLGNEEMISGDFGRMDLPAIRVLGLSIGILWVLLFHMGEAWKHVVSYKWHILFLAFCLCSLTWSPSAAYGFRMLAKLTAPFLFLLLIRTTVTTIRQLTILEVCVILGAVVSLGLALATKLSGKLPNQGDMLTIPATSAAVFSAHLVTASILVLAGLIHGGRRSIYLGVLICLVAGTIAAFTRITIGALFVASSIMIFLSLHGIARFALPLGGLVGLPTLFLLSERFRNRMFYGGENISIGSVISDPAYALDHVHGSGRFPAWAQFLHQFFEPTPVVGSGVGATQHYFYTHSVTGLGVIHSEYIRLLCEVGIVGLILFLLACAVYLVRLFRSFDQDAHDRVKRYRLAAMGGMIAYLIFLATDNGFDYVSQFGIFVFGYIGISEKAKEILLNGTEQFKIESTDGDNILADETHVSKKPVRFPILQH